MSGIPHQDPVHAGNSGKAASVDLLDGGSLRRKVFILGMNLNFIAGFAMIVYLWPLLSFSKQQIISLLWLIAIAGSIGSVVILLVQNHFVGRIACYLDARRNQDVTDELRYEAFRCIIQFPKIQVLLAFSYWALIGSSAAFLLFQLYEQFTLLSVWILLASALAYGFLTQIFGFVLLKSIFEPVRNTLALEIEDPDFRNQLVHPMSIEAKIAASGTGVAICTAVIMFVLGLGGGMRTLEEFSTRTEQGLLAFAQRQLESESDLDLALETLRSNSPEIGIEFLVIDPRDNQILAGPTGYLQGSEISFLSSTASNANAEQNSRGFDSLNSFSWVPFRDELLLVAVTPGMYLRAQNRSRVYFIGVVWIVSVALTIGVALFMAKDFSKAIAALSVQVRRVTSGDLTRANVFESEDQHGELARELDKMASRLREMVGGVASTVRRVEDTAVYVAQASASVAKNSAQELEATEEASAAIFEITAQTGGISDFAESLDLTVRESSSAVQELQGVGIGLKENAMVLFQRSEEASTSVESMIESLRHVASNAETLSEFSATSAQNMGQMVSTVEEIKTNAMETAKLSDEVVEAAEKGERQVEHTIDGMEQINEATELARSVIYRLGDRARSIGSMVGVIDDVADETNLLALNAAIIAAQAGEHGRSFSVVADEIKDLAVRVVASTKEISNLVAALQEESEQAVGAVEKGASSVQEGVGLSAEAGRSLEHITTATRGSGQRINDIVSLVREHATVASSVLSMMGELTDHVEEIHSAAMKQELSGASALQNSVDVDNVAQQVRTSADEQAGSTQYLNQNIENVQSFVDKIRQALSEQTEACQRVAEFIEALVVRTRANHESTTEMGGNMKELLEEATQLQQEIERFRIK